MTMQQSVTNCTTSNGYTCICGAWVAYGTYHHYCARVSPNTFYYSWPLIACEHCYCQDDERATNSEPHARCCKCHTQMAKRFLPKATKR